MVVLSSDLTSACSTINEGLGNVLASDPAAPLLKGLLNAVFLLLDLSSLILDSSSEEESDS